MYPVLRQRNFRLLFVGGFVSSAGDWLLSLALPFYVYQQTNSAFAGALAFILHILPQVALGSVAGVFVDRWDRRRTMLAADLIRALLIFLLFPAALSEHWLWLAFPIITLEAVVSQFFGPAKGSLLPRLVGKDDLLSANALFTVSDSALRLLAPALGGILFAIFGLGSVVAIDSGSYLFSALMIFLLQPPKDVSSSVTEEVVQLATSRWVRFWQDWLAGLRYVAADPLLRSLLVVTGLASLASGIYGPLLQVFVVQQLHAGADVLGLMTSATGVGTLAMGLILGRLTVGRRMVLTATLGQILYGIALLITFAMRDIPIVVTLSALVGFAMASAVGFGTLVQAHTDDRFRGRVLGANGTTRALLMVLGEAGGSVVAGQVGLLPILDTACVILVLGGLLGLALLPRVTVSTPATAEA